VGIVKPQEADTSCRFEVLYFNFGAGVLHLFQCSFVGPETYDTRQTSNNPIGSCFLPDRNKPLITLRV